MRKLHSILTKAHGDFAYIELILVLVFLVALFAVMFGYSGRVTKLLRKSTLFVMIFFHIQLIVGFVMLIGTSEFLNTIKAVGMGKIMKDAYLRQSFVEHPTSMLIAAILMTIVNKKIKKAGHLSMSAFWLSVVAILFFGFAFSIIIGRLFGV